MRKNKFYTLDNVEVSAVSSEGKGIAKIDGKVIFIDDAVTGDIVTIQSKRSSKNFEKAKILEIKTPSQYRVVPYCQHYEHCGGCKTQHISYVYQLKWKEETVRSAIERIGKIENVSYLPIIGCEETRYYRNKLDYAASNKRWLSYEELNSDEVYDDRSGLGFHLAGMFDKVLNLEECFHMPSPNNDIRNFINEQSRELEISFYDIKAQTGVLRNVMFRKNVKNEWMVCIIVAEFNKQVQALMSSIHVKFPEIVSLMYAVNTKKNDSIYDLDFEVFKGQEFIFEYLKEKKFKITAKSFFQTNTNQCINLYDEVGKLANIQSGDVVYDLYCGVGSIGIYLADIASKIVGVDSVKEAIQDADINAKLNGFENCHYFASDMKDIFDEQFIENNGKPNIIITDPPRAGMHLDVVHQLGMSQCPTIVYVSCNPQTMANDLKELSQYYTVASIQPVDMFPNTVHIEAIALLKRKEE